MSYSSKPRVITKRKRFEVFKRDGYRCCLCGASALDWAKLEVDHKIPYSRGGSNDMSNLWTLCFDCNRGKSDQALGEAKMTEGVASLVGRPVHYFRDGEIFYQGTIVAIDESQAIIQLYSWIDGHPTNIIAVSRSDLFSHQWRIYASDYEWHKAFYEQEERKERLKESVEENIRLSINDN